MHVGIDCRLPYYRMGGISQYVLQLVAALATLDHQNTYSIFYSRLDERNRAPVAPNFRNHRLWTPCHHRLERWTLSAELLPHRLDVLHSPDFIPPALGARRMVITVHDLNFLHYPQFLTPESRRYYAGQIAGAVRKADHISVDSQATRHDLIGRLAVPPEKVTTVHLAANPIYQQRHAQEAVNETLMAYNLPRGFVLFVGTMEPRKNLPTLIEAYGRLLRQAKIDAPLVLVGSKGWFYEEVFATIERMELQGRVRHLESVGNEQLAHLYAAAGLLALPSHYEGFGLPVLEAMHSGCPVIASNVASLPEIAGEAGILLPPSDVDAWATAMRDVLSDGRLREDMVEKGKRQAAKFSWEKAARETLQIYQAG